MADGTEVKTDPEVATEPSTEAGTPDPDEKTSDQASGPEVEQSENPDAGAPAVPVMGNEHEIEKGEIVQNTPLETDERRMLVTREGNPLDYLNNPEVDPDIFIHSDGGLTIRLASRDGAPYIIQFNKATIDDICDSL